MASLFWVLGGAAAVLAALVLQVRDGFVQVPEGSVGVVFFAGRILPETLPPGVHTKLAVISRVEVVAAMQQTTTIHNIQCQTRSAVTAVFPSVDVVLSADKTRVPDLVRNFTGAGLLDSVVVQPLQAVFNKICSRLTLREATMTKFDTLNELVEEQLGKIADAWTGGGLRIEAVRLSRPRVPARIQDGYEQLENLRAQERVVKEQRAMSVRQSETVRRQAIMAAERELEVSRIHVQRRLDGAEGRLRLAGSDTTTAAAALMAQADAEAYGVRRAAEAERVILTREALALEAAERLYSNMRMYLGNAIPRSIVEEPDAPAAGAAAAAAQSARRAQQPPPTAPPAGQPSGADHKRPTRPDAPRSMVIDALASSDEAFEPQW